MSQLKVSIIIVHYQRFAETLRCIKSIYENKGRFLFEVILVDNNNLAKEKVNLLNKDFSALKYIKSPKNLGYGAGNNLGAKHARGEYLFILNPDTKVLTYAVDNLVSFLEEKKEVGIVAPNLLDSKGKLFSLQGTRMLTPLSAIFSLSLINKIFPNNPISRSYWMKEVSKKNLREVDVVPGTAFMIRRNVFESLGGFDENFFLYFEESDLCKKVKELGWKIYMIPQARVTHYWKSSEGSELLKKEFQKSRYYYFKKHYGLINALLVEAFTRFTKRELFLFTIISLGTFLRFYRINENLIFHGEVGLDYLRIKDFIEKGELPLFGPRTSHKWFYIGPLFYWIFMVVMPLGAYQPVTGAYFFAAVGVLAIYVCYLTISKLLDNRTALITSYLMAISPLWLEYTRASRYNIVAAYLFFPFLYLLINSLKNKGKYFFWLGLTLGVMWSFFPAPIVLLPITLLIVLSRREKIVVKYIWQGFGGLIIPNIPYFIGIFRQRSDMIIKIVQWVPYRVAGFFGIVPKNTVNYEVLSDNIYSLFNFFAKSFTFDINRITIISTIILIIYMFIKSKSERENRTFWKVFSVIFAVAYIGLFLHGSPPEHYYFVIFPIPLLLLGSLLSDIMRKKYGVYFSLFILIIITAVNLNYYFSEKWFFIPQDKVRNGKLPVPYNLQEKVTDKIIEDANGQNFSLHRVGQGDYFDDDFAQNYIYLLSLKGNQPVESAKLGYTIYEDLSKLEKEADVEIFWVSNLAIVKQAEENSKDPESEL